MIPYSTRKMQQRKAAIPVLSEERLRRPPALGSQTLITSMGRDFDTFVLASCCRSFETLYLHFFSIFLNGGWEKNCYALCQVNLQRLLI